MDFAQLSRCTRINVVGTAGSGKSTFARRLAEILDLPYVEMDCLFWQPGWQETTDSEFFAKVHEATVQDRWVIDGNYTRTIPEKWKRVQAVVWLDLSLARTVYRVTKRCIERSLTRRELWPGTGNRETLRKSFLSSDSVIWWAITSHRRNREMYESCMADSEFAHVQFLRLTTPSTVAGCLESASEAVQEWKASTAALDDRTM